MTYIRGKYISRKRVRISIYVEKENEAKTKKNDEKLNKTVLNREKNTKALFAY